MEVRELDKGAQMWYQQGHDILLQYWSEPHEFVSCFAKKSRKNQEESNNQWWTCDQWDFLPNQLQKTHEEQEETEQSRKDHERECPLTRQILAHLVNSIGNVWMSDNEVN